MSELIIKIFICPLTVLMAFFIFPNVHYANILQAIIVGVLLACTAHIIGVLIIKKGAYWLSSVVDFALATLIIYFASLFFTNAVVTFTGAVITALILTFTEVIQHNWFVYGEKSPT